MIDGLINGIKLLNTIFATAVVIRIVLNLVQVSPYHPVQQWLYRLTEPLLRPIRNVMPEMGGLDFSPMVLLIALQIGEQVLVALLQSLR